MSSKDKKNQNKVFEPHEDSFFEKEPSGAEGVAVDGFEEEDFGVYLIDDDDFQMPLDSPTGADAPADDFSLDGFETDEVLMEEAAAFDVGFATDDDVTETENRKEDFSLHEDFEDNFSGEEFLFEENPAEIQLETTETVTVRAGEEEDDLDLSDFVVEFADTSTDAELDFLISSESADSVETIELDEHGFEDEEGVIADVEPGTPVIPSMEDSISVSVDEVGFDEDDFEPVLQLPSEEENHHNVSEVVIEPVTESISFTIAQDDLSIIDSFKKEAKVLKSHEASYYFTEIAQLIMLYQPNSIPEALDYFRRAQQIRALSKIEYRQFFLAALQHANESTLENVVERFAEVCESRERGYAHAKLAEVLQSKRKLMASSVAFEKAVANNPNDFLSLYQLASIQERLGEWESASTTYERLARQSSGTLKAHFLYRKATLQESRLFEEQEAVHTLHSVLSLNPSDRSARVSLLRILLKQKSLLSDSKNASLFSGTVFEYRKFVAELEDRPTQAWKHLSTEGALFWFRIQKMPMEKKKEQLRNYLSFAQGMDETIALWYLSSIDPEFAQKGLANLCEKDAAALFVVNALGTGFMTSCAWASKLAASDPVVAISILCTILIQEGLPEDEYEISALADALEDIEHPDISVLKELIFIMDDRALPLAALYSRRAKAEDDPNWKAHWLVQAARYSEDAQALELYREAQQINSAMSIGYTEQYTRLIRSGEFLGALEMLQLQSKLTLPTAYLFVVQLLSANPNRELPVSKGLWGRLSNYRNACRNNNTRKIYESLKIFGDELSPRAQLWAYIDLVYREMDKNILVKVLTEGQALPSSIRVAAVLSNLSLRVPDLTSLLRQILKNDQEDTESQLLLLSIALERKEKNLIPILVQGLQLDADAKGQLSILLEAEEDWQSALSCCESESEKAEIIDAYLPERREEVWAGVFQTEPSIKSAFGLIGCGANLREAYEWIANSAGEVKPKIAFYNYAATLALRHGDIDIAQEHFSYSFKHEPFAGRSFYGLKQIALMEKNGELLKKVFNSLGNEIWAEYALGLELVEEYESSIEIYDKHLKKLKNTPQYPIITCKLERLCEKNGEWERLYQLLNERRGIWRSSEGITEIETKLRWLMLEHLPHKPETLIFFKELSNKYPRNIEIAEALARISISHGDYHEGIEALKRLLEGSKDPQKGAKYYYYIADAYLKMKEIGQGISYLQKSIHLDFYNEQARQTLKGIFYEQSQYGDLIQLLGFEGERLKPEQRKESLVELAKLYSETLKRYDDAIDIWSKLWQVDQDNQHILEELINISHRSGDLKKQIKYIKSSLQIQEDPSLRLRLAFIYKDSVKDPSQALVHFEKAAQNLGTQEEALLELNNLYREKGDIPKYIETLQKRAGLADGVSNKINLLEEVFSDGDDLGTDINLYPICESILALEPMHQRALSYVADVAFEREDWDKCMTVFANLKPLKEGLKLNSFEAQLNYSEFFFRYGVVLLKVGEQSEGIDVLTQLHKRFPNHLNTLQVLGQALLESSDWERAADIFRRQLMAVGGSNSAQTAEVYYQLGFIEHKRGSYKEAAHYYMKARKLNPTSLKIYKGLASISMETQSWTRSLHIYQKIIESQQATHQDIRDGMLVKAWILDKKLERSEAAFKHYEKSHQFDPKQPIVILRLGEFYLDVNPQKALICVDKALGLLKDSSPSLVRLGHGIRYLCLAGLRKSVESEAELKFLSDTGPSVESWVRAELAELIV